MGQKCNASPCLTQGQKRCARLSPALLGKGDPGTLRGVLPVEGEVVLHLSTPGDSAVLFVGSVFSSVKQPGSVTL